MELGESFNPQTPAEEAESVAAFAGIVSLLTPTFMERILDSAERSRENGQQGVTLPSEDRSLVLTVDTAVSFRIDGVAPQAISIERAREIIADIQRANLEN